MTQKGYSLTRPTFVLMLAWIVLAGGSLEACARGEPAGEVAMSTLSVWLDQPIDGSTLPLAAFTLKAHASDAGGGEVTSISFSVNTIPAGTATLETVQSLTYGEVEWNPSAPGEYTIQAQATGANGEAISQVARVCVGDPCNQEPTPQTQPDATAESTGEPTITPTRTITLAPGVTVTQAPATPTASPVAVTKTAGPTSTACSLSVPGPSSPPHGSTVSDPYPILSWTYASNDCPPDSFQVEICSDSGCGSLVQSGSTGSPSTTWAPGQPLADCMTYYWRVVGSMGATLGPYSAFSSFTTAFPDGCGGSKNDNPPPVQDTTPPALNAATAPSLQSPPTYYGSTCAPRTDQITFVISASDPSGISSVVLTWRYRTTDGKTSDWKSLTMSSSGGDTYSAVLDHATTYYTQAYDTLGGTNGILEYQITATDGAGNSADYSSSTEIWYCIG